MKPLLPAHSFFYPRTEKDLIVGRFAEIHHARLKYLLPLLILVGLFLLGSDLLPAYRHTAGIFDAWYIPLDAGFAATQLLFFLLFLFTARHGTDRRGRIGRPFVVTHAALSLCWAAVVAAIELHQTGNVTTIIIAVMAAAMLLLLSFLTICLLLALPVAVFFIALPFVPGDGSLAFERMMFLVSLLPISVFISRSIFSVFVESILSTLRLAAVNEELHTVQMSLIQKEKFATIGQLSAGIAHEINNPLGFIKSNFSTLEQNFAYIQKRSSHLLQDEAYLFFSESMSGSSKRRGKGFRRISEVIDNLRSFSYELPEGYFRKYNLNQGIESTLVLARNTYKEIARIEKSFRPVVDVDARGSEINQVLLNLILNAVNAIASQKKNSPGSVTVSTWSDTASVYCDITDSGPGVSPELRTRIFDPFYTTKPVGEGLGLGLSLSYEIIVNRHHGTLALLEGMPTTFRLSLPIRQPTPHG